MNLNDLVINKKDPIYKQTIKLKTYIDRKVKEKNFRIFIHHISKLFKIPESIIEFDVKKYLSQSHNFKKGQFDRIFKFYNIPFSSVIYLVSLIFIYLFSKKNDLPKEKVEIIFDEITSSEQQQRMLKLAQEFKSFKTISDKKLDGSKNNFIFYKYIGTNKVLFKKKCLSLFFYNFFLVYKLSLLEKTNLFPLVTILVKRILKYETIFSYISGKYLFQERPYATSAIKNFLFKKYGGNKSCCTQRILFHLGSTSFYINTDILFSLGRKSHSGLKLTGSKIRKIIPAGSYVFFLKWFKTKKRNTQKFDLIYLSGNNTPSFSIDNKYIKNYYETLNWLKRFNNEYPFYKIAFKHHENNYFHDIKELNILNTSNIKRISGPTKPGEKNYSYGYAINSKVRLTWCSTMGYELLGHNFKCYFLDPNHENIGFLHDEKYNKKFRIKDYHDFKKIVLNDLNNKKTKSIINPHDFCLKSQNVSKIISKNLRKI